MSCILVVGALPQDSEGKRSVAEFAASLGKAIIDRHHVLLTLCESSFDLALARGAYEALEKSGQAAQAGQRIISYFRTGQTPAHDLGKVRRSQVDW